MQQTTASNPILSVEDKKGDEPCQAWFCVESQVKHEHIAAGYLRQFEDVEVFNPRIRFTRSTSKGPATVTEALFPGYLFARFTWPTGLAKVRYGRGVKGVVHFGTRWPTVPESVIEQIRTSLGPGDLHVIQPGLEEGDTVQLSGGAFHGLEAVITQVLPGSQRVVVLMEFLGRQSNVEVDSSTLIKKASY